MSKKRRKRFRHKRRAFKDKNKIKKNKYQNENAESHIGIFYPIRSKDAFVVMPDGSEFFVPSFCTNTAIHEDEVELEVLKNAPGRGKLPEACIVRIVKRKHKNFVGKIAKDLNGLYFVPDRKKLPEKMLILEESDLQYDEHDKVYVSLVSWEKPTDYPKVKIIENLGKAGDHEVESKAILLEHRFKSSFPPEVETYAEKIRAIAETEKLDFLDREDFRNKITFTIDPENAKDFDDALSVHKIQEGYEIGVHIADVSHFVKYQDRVDKEAQKRGTSVYLVDRTIPMLPEALSNDLCSLNPEEDKRAFSVIFNFNENLELLNYRFAKTVIRSNKRFTYQEAQNILDLKRGEFYEELKILKKLADKLRKERLEKGALDFDSQEIAFELDKDGKPTKAYIKERLETMKMIEDLMLLANKSVAEFMQERLKKDRVSSFIFRIHDKPDPEKIEELAVFLDALGLELKHKAGEVDLLSLSKLLKSLENHTLKASIEQSTLRAMAKAVYSHKNIGHFSLGFQDYTHFTSPIRRYPDVMVHRILWATLQNKPLSKKELDHYKILAVESSRREIEAAQAERESIKYKQVEYMQSFVGKEFNCTVTGMTKNGLFLAEEQTLAEGFAAFSSAGKVIYYDEEQRLAKSTDGLEIRIGDKLKAKLLRADLENKQIDWALLL